MRSKYDPTLTVVRKQCNGRRLFRQALPNSLGYFALQRACWLYHMLLGENQDRLIRRIRDVMQDGRKRAKRIAQTEGTRVQSQARYNTLKDGAAMGINVRRRWSTRMVNSRETHIALNGKTVGMDENFVTTAGNVLRYPGDPTAPAAEVVNCHCVVVPVVKAGEGAADGLQNTAQNGTMNPSSGSLAEIQMGLEKADIRLPNGETSRMVSGSTVTDYQIFAGYGSSKPLRVAEHLQRKHPGSKAEYWNHAKAHVMVYVSGTAQKANVHWFYESSVGMHDVYVKGWSKK